MGSKAFAKIPYSPMDQVKWLKQTEGSFSLAGDHASVLAGKLEDLLFRAQRIARALRSDSKAPAPDQMFGYDLQNFRRSVREFANETAALSSTLHNIELRGVYDEDSVGHAQALMRLADRLKKSLEGLRDHALLAHAHIRQAEHKVEAWYLTQETEALVNFAQPLPSLANKILIKVSTPGGPDEPPKA